MGSLRTVLSVALVLGLQSHSLLLAAESRAIIQNGQVNPRELLNAGGFIGYITIGLSIAMLAAVIEHLLSIRREALMPRALAEELQKQIANGQLQQAEQLCKQHPVYLTEVLRAGLLEAPFGYEAVEKAMEDAAVEQTARLSRKIEFLAVVGGVAPMLGLLGTVWGMIQAFAEFAEKANPSPADFAPAISEALVTTLFGLCVAIPALAAYAWFRNKIDELSAQAALLAEFLVNPLRRSLREKRRVATPVAALPPSAPRAQG